MGLSLLSIILTAALKLRLQSYSNKTTTYSNRRVCNSNIVVTYLKFKTNTGSLNLRGVGSLPRASELKEGAPSSKKDLRMLSTLLLLYKIHLLKCYSLSDNCILPTCIQVSGYVYMHLQPAHEIMWFLSSIQK